MLLGLFVVLMVLWILGNLTGFAAGGLIHILLVLAAISLIGHFIAGRKTTA